MEEESEDVVEDPELVEGVEDPEFVEGVEDGSCGVEEELLLSAGGTEVTLPDPELLFWLLLLPTTTKLDRETVSCGCARAIQSKFVSTVAGCCN